MRPDFPCVVDLVNVVFFEEFDIWYGVEVVDDFLFVWHAFDGEGDAEFSGLCEFWGDVSVLVGGVVEVVSFEVEFGCDVLVFGSVGVDISHVWSDRFGDAVESLLCMDDFLSVLGFALLKYGLIDVFATLLCVKLVDDSAQRAAFEDSLNG